MSDIKKTEMHLGIFLLGLVLLAAAMFQGYSLSMTSLDGVNYVYSVYQSAATGGPLPVPPPERFLGTGPVGTLFPAIAGAVAGILLGHSYRKLR